MQAHFGISSIITGDVQIRSDPPGLQSHRSYPSRMDIVWLSGCISFYGVVRDDNTRSTPPFEPLCIPAVMLNAIDDRGISSIPTILTIER
jgi:hypothetical protein